MAFRALDRDENGDWTEEALVGGLMESEAQQAQIATARMFEALLKGLSGK